MAALLPLAKAAESIPDFLTSEINDAAVLNAARQLISRHRAGQSFDIEALDVPHRAFAAIGEKLESSGISHALSAPLVEALRRYVMESGGAFARAVNAKPVMIRMIVAPEMPACRFEHGMTELACLGTNDVRVEGSSSINVRATPTGTATTSNAADVDAMFAHVKGLNLWIRFESPTREEMDALLSTMESALAGVVQSIGGAMSADDLRKLIEQLEAEGSLTPAVLDLINKAILLQEGIKSSALSGEELQAALNDLGALMDDIQANNLAPDALLQAIMSSIASLPSSPALLAFLTEQGFQNILADNDNISADEIAAQEMGEELMLLLEEIAAQIEAGEITLEDIPPELAALIDALGGVESILAPENRMAHLEMIAQSLSQDAQTPLTEIIHAAVISLMDSSVLSSLPPSVAALAQSFADNNPALIEMAVASSLLADMQETLSGMDVLSSETASFQLVMDAVRQDGFSALMNTNMQSSMPYRAAEAVQSFAQSHPSAVEIAATHVFLESLNTYAENFGGDSPEIEEIRTQVKEKGVTAFFEDQPDVSPRVRHVVETVVGGGGPRGNPTNPDTAPVPPPSPEKDGTGPEKDADPSGGPDGNPPRPDGQPEPEKQTDNDPSNDQDDKAPPTQPGPGEPTPLKESDAKGPKEDKRPDVSPNVLDCCKDLELPPSPKTPEERAAIQEIFTQQWGGGNGNDSVTFEYNPDTNEVTIFEDGNETTMTYEKFSEMADDYTKAIKEKEELEIRVANLDGFPNPPPTSNPDEPTIKPEFKEATDPFFDLAPDFTPPPPDRMDDVFGFSDFDMK